MIVTVAKQFAAFLLSLFFAEIVAVIITFMLVSYGMKRAMHSVTVCDDITTDFEMNSVPEGA